MKKFKNKIIDLNGVKKNYSTLIEECVKDVPEKGIDLIEMKARLHILDAVKDANGEISLEDSDVALLKQLFDKTKWGIISHEIIVFTDDIKKL